MESEAHKDGQAGAASPRTETQIIRTLITDGMVHQGVAALARWDESRDGGGMSPRATLFARYMLPCDSKSRAVRVNARFAAGFDWDVVHLGASGVDLQDEFLKGCKLNSFFSPPARFAPFVYYGSAAGTLGPKMVHNSISLALHRFRPIYRSNQFGSPGFLCVVVKRCSEEICAFLKGGALPGRTSEWLAVGDGDPKVNFVFEAPLLMSYHADTPYLLISQRGLYLEPRTLCGA